MKMEECVSPWLTPALMTERTSWAESIGVYSDTFALGSAISVEDVAWPCSKSKGISIPAKICNEPGECKTFTTVTSKPRRALERTH
jgi:hypothetical protein